jgi:[protein-PII] uridylyltransferase
LTQAVLSRGCADLRARHDAGAPGREIVRSYALLMDRLISVLFGAATCDYFSRNLRIKYRCAVMAQGGYGRRELSPRSDIDLVFLYPWKANPYVETVAEKILYTLWDSGLTVGHALRNPRTCVRLAERDLTVKTALLDARYICGDVGVFMEFKQAAESELLNKHTEAFLEEKLAANAKRHRQYGDSVYLLQPQLKEGAGGLRDVHTALWMAKVKFKIRRLRDLVRLGIVTERELAELEMSQDFLWRLRNSLHFIAGAHQDQLSFEYQEQVAAAHGYRDTPSAPAVERFMRVYYLHAATVNRFSDAVISRCIERTRAYGTARTAMRTVYDGMRVKGDMLTVASSKVFRERPANLLRVFGEAQRHGVGLSPITKEHIREHLQLIDDQLRCDPEAAAAFLDILRGRRRVYETLHEMHKHGVLIRFIPEFAKLWCLVRRDLYHIYTVDEHSLRGILELERLRGGAYAQSCPLLTEVMREDDNVAILFLGMLFHDIGKGEGQGHAERGAILVRDISVRLGLNLDEATQLEFLVRHHLWMSHLAYRRDIHNDSLVLGFAKQAGDVSSLRKLYLLTFADMKAVGPAFWNNWRDMLLGELYRRALQMLERGVLIEEDRAGRVARVKQRVRRTMARAGRDRGVERFLTTMPDRYFLATPEEHIPRHIILVDRFQPAAADGGPVMETALSHFPVWDYSEFTVCTADRPGLFSMLAGVLAAAGLNIVSARITTSTDGTVLDEFRISHVDSRETVLEESRWERVRRTLEAVLRGAVDVEALVEESRRPSVLSKGHHGGSRGATDVHVDNEVSPDSTVLDVYTQDRVGVLFTITNCLYRLGLQIHLAKITTTVDQVLDVFYVTDGAGQKVEDAKRLEMIKHALVDRLQQDPVSTAEAAQWTSVT